MSCFLIEGGNPLSGEIKVQGAKNAVLPILSASLLNRGRTVLKNCPDLSDVSVAVEILKSLGCRVKRRGDIIETDSSCADKYVIPHRLMNKMRSSVMFLGSILGRNKKAVISYPGGCDLGARPIDLHIKALRELNVETEEELGVILCVSEEIRGCEIYLDFPSVGATENIILASVLGKGKTVILNPAKEPEIVDLQNFINQMGGDVKGCGTDRIEINGVKELHSAEYEIMPDRIVTATYLFAAAGTGGNIKVNNIGRESLESVCRVLEEMGAELKCESGSIELEAPKKIRAVNVETKVYPGFPTDAQPLLAPCLCFADGRSHITENIFSRRFMYASQLNKMNADISIAGNTMTVNPVRKLMGATVYAQDLRGGAALVLAGLMAHGTTRVANTHFIERGYENTEEIINFLGGNIKRVQ